MLQRSVRQSVGGAAQAQPGDLVFFEKTYNCPEPVSHIGIYVGNGKMLHCGNPIGYADIYKPYWKSHLYGFGRLGSGGK